MLTIYRLRTQNSGRRLNDVTNNTFLLFNVPLMVSFQKKEFGYLAWVGHERLVSLAWVGHVGLVSFYGRSIHTAVGSNHQTIL